MEKLISYYKGFLESLDATVDDEGRVYHSFGVLDASPLNLKVGKTSIPVYLPTRKLLANPEFSKEANCLFHPLSESVSRGGESEMLKTLRLMMEVQISTRLSLLLPAIAQAVAKGHKLKGKQAAWLAPIADADDKFVKFVSDVVGASDFQGRNRLFKFYLARGNKLNGKKYARTCVATFPIVEALESEKSDTLFGVKYPRKKDRVLMDGLLAVVLGENRDDDLYFSRGSNSPVAPYFDALIEGYRLVVDDVINVAVGRYSPILPKDLFGKKDGRIALGDWAEHKTAFFRHRDDIPPMPHNTGEVEEKGASMAPRKAPHMASATVDDDTPPWEEPSSKAPPHLRHAAKPPHQTPQPTHTASDKKLPPHLAKPAAAPAPAYQPLGSAAQAPASSDPYDMDSLTLAAHARAHASQHTGFIPPGAIRRGPPGGYNGMPNYGGAPMGYNPGGYGGRNTWRPSFMTR